MEHATIKVKNIKSKVTGLSPSIVNLLSNHLTVKVPNFYFSAAYKNGYWDGTQKFFTRPANTFPTGLLPRVVEFLQDACDDIVIDIEDERFGLGKYVIPKLQDGYELGENKILRDYQINTVNTIAENNVLGIPFYRGVINIATNGGKTVIAEGIMNELYPQLKKNKGVFLFITHSKEIAHQTQRSIENDLGITTGFIGDGMWEVKPITIAIVTTMYRRLKDGKAEFEELKDKVIGIIADECLHGDSKILLPGNKYATISEICNSDAITEVVSFNLEKQIFEVKPILRKIVTPNTKKFLQIWYNDPFTQQLNFLRATGNHKIWTANRGYVRADELTERDIIKVRMPDYHVHVAKISTYNSPHIPKFKYNLEIADNHNYFADGILVSNCHHSSAASFQEVLNRFENAFIRIGLTGTVDKSNPINEMKLYSCTGPIVKKISNNYLIDKGVSAKPICLMFKVSQPDINDMEYQDAYNYGIVENEFRHDIIYDICDKETRDGNKVLILVERLEHGQNLENNLVALHKEVYFTHGQLSSSDRESYLEMLKLGKLDILIASNILDEGVDISGINAVIYARGMKSMRKLLQGIGRGLRLKSDRSNLRFYDFIDDTNMKLLLHSKERYETLAEEKFLVKLMNQDDFMKMSWEEIMEG